jgi:hypothetical protein
MAEQTCYCAIFYKKNILRSSVLLFTIVTLLSLAIGIPLSQTVDNLRRAKEILDRHILIDGYNFF